MRELKPNELKRFFSPAELDFTNTAELDATHGLIGQGRAAAAFNFGLSTRMAGYNIYVLGVMGSGKTAFAIQFARNAAKMEKTPQDL
ncbi:MAG: AAA family ATPase, partial [Defluviitaleaceae bacterium]|nr:AAA family ATPase [Defluviitaleaceae bacterium]